MLVHAAQSRAPRRTRTRSRSLDASSGYGWISIALHWVGAVVVLALLFVGSSIGSSGADRMRVIELHTSIAVAAYLILWWRIVWRFRCGHPGPLPAQRGWSFAAGRLVHYALLLAMVMMLISGPLMVWSRGQVIHVFAASIPGPFAQHRWLAEISFRVHAFGATVLAVGTALHLAGVFKHVAFNRDGTFDKMVIAARSREAAGGAQQPQRPQGAGTFVRNDSTPKS